jgi:hypothetical protein
MLCCTVQPTNPLTLTIAPQTLKLGTTLVQTMDAHLRDYHSSVIEPDVRSGWRPGLSVPLLEADAARRACSGRVLLCPPAQDHSVLGMCQSATWPCCALEMQIHV